MAKKQADKKPAKPKEGDVVELITQGPAISEYVKDADSLTDWFNFYLKANSDPESHTFRAKLQDVERFLHFFFEKTNTYHPDQWTPAITKSFLKWLPKQKARDRKKELTDRNLAPSTCSRNINTLKHAARWIHRQRPFLTGFPFNARDVIEVTEPAWQGLTDLQVTRMISASEQLIKLNTRSNQLPHRNHAQLLMLCGIGFRVSEMNNLEFSQYQDKHLVNVFRSKGNKVQEKIFLDKTIREAVDAYIEHERGDGPGPLFLSKSGGAMDQSGVYRALKKIAAQANSTLPNDEQIEIHPHLLRHTALRKVSKKKDIRVAREVSGLRSDKYLWRYIKATDTEVEEALTDLWEE